MEESKTLIEGYKKWAGEMPSEEPGRSIWLSRFGAYILGFTDCEERLLTPHAPDGSEPCAHGAKYGECEVLGCENCYETRRR